MYEWYEHACLCCGRKGRLTFDHVIPLSKGGENTILNAQPLCRSCNCSKYTSIIDYRPPERHAEFMALLEAEGPL